MNNERGISCVSGGPIKIAGTQETVAAVKGLSKFGLITFSRTVKFKSTEYTISFFKPTSVLKAMYSLNNELLVVCCSDGMKDFKARTKDFIDYILVTNTEFKNRLDKVTCFVIDGNEDIVNIIKNDRFENPDSRLIVPFYNKELIDGLTEDEFNNRLRNFLYEKDLFGIAVPLRDDSLFFGKDRTDVISELYAKYKHGEEGGLFGLRRIGKTSILNILKKRVVESGGVAVYIDCSGFHHYRWNEFLKQIIDVIISEYSEKTINDIPYFIESPQIDLSEERYDRKNAARSFSGDLGRIYQLLNQKRILIIFDEIENISFKTSPSKPWREDNDSLNFWQSIRSLVQMHVEYMSFVVAGVNPMCVETHTINGFDNPIFGMLSPIYVKLFEYEDIKKMISQIGGRLGLKFEEAVYAKLMEDYGGHPFLIRQVCSRINGNLLDQKVDRPCTVSRNSYILKSDDYRQALTSIIEQILSVIEKYYKNEFELLKRLALDGRDSFKKEIALGDKGIQHLIGYCLIEKEDGEYFIRIKSIEDYIKSKYVYDTTLSAQSDRRTRINIRRDGIETRLRSQVGFALKSKYGKKAKENLISIVEKTTTDKSQKSKLINAPSLTAAIDELYLSQLKDIIDKEWKYFQSIFPDKSKYEAYMDLLNRARTYAAHAKPVSDQDEVSFSIAFDFFEDALED